MKASEFINEATKNGTMPKTFQRATQGGETRMRDVGGYDRVYHLNRFWMATAMADGKSRGPVDMDCGSFAEKYNVAVPYTDAEYLMVLSAMATIPTDGKELQKRGKSEEAKDTNTLSPVSNWMKKK